MTPDQYRREGFRTGIEAAVHQVKSMRATDGVLHKQTQNLIVTALNITAIRAIDVDEVLAGLPAPDAARELDHLRGQHAEWSERQFGPVSAVGPAKHLAKEALEVAAAPADATEHADCWMLLWDMQRRAGISDADLATAIREKLAINMARDWPPAKEGEAREHIRGDDAQAAPDAVSRLVEAARAVVLAYQEANPMRTAAMHPDECDCLRCKSDWLDHVSGGFRKETDHDHT